MPDLDTFLKTTAVQGLEHVLLGAVVLAIITVLGWLLLFLRKFGPSVAEAHVKFVNTCQTTQVQISDSLSTLAESHEAHVQFVNICQKTQVQIAESLSTLVESHHKTHRALGHVAEGLRYVVPDEGKRHLDSAKESLE